MHEAGWYAKNIHITGDKRWYGRYGFVKFSKVKGCIFNSYDEKVF
jgi:hypothetical protein